MSTSTCPTKTSLCFPLIQKYNVVPGVSWGTAPASIQTFMTTNNCQNYLSCPQAFSLYGITDKTFGTAPDWIISSVVGRCQAPNNAKWTIPLMLKYGYIPPPYTGYTYGSTPDNMKTYIASNTVSVSEVKAYFGMVTPTSFGSTPPLWSIEYVLDQGHAQGSNEDGWTPLLVSTFNIQYPSSGNPWGAMSWGTASTYVQKYINANPPSASSLMTQYGMSPPSTFGTAPDWAVDIVLYYDTTGAWSNPALAVKYNISISLQDGSINWGNALKLPNLQAYVKRTPTTCQQLISAYNMNPGVNFGSASDWAIVELLSKSI